MSDIAPPNFEKKSFWKRPEGVTGAVFLIALMIGGGALLYKFMPVLLGLAANTLYLAAMLAALAALIYVVLDPKMRNLIWYGYKSIMRGITGMFVEIDPIGILKTYVENLENSLGKMSKQIGILKGQKTQLTNLMGSNNKEIETNMKLA